MSQQNLTENANLNVIDPISFTYQDSMYIISDENQMNSQIHEEEQGVEEQTTIKKEQRDRRNTRKQGQNNKNQKPDNKYQDETLGHIYSTNSKRFSRKQILFLFSDCLSEQNQIIQKIQQLFQENLNGYGIFRRKKNLLISDFYFYIELKKVPELSLIQELKGDINNIEYTYIGSKREMMEKLTIIDNAPQFYHLMLDDIQKFYLNTQLRPEQQKLLEAIENYKNQAKQLADKFLLTYRNISESKQQLLNQLEEKLQIKGFIIGEEEDVDHQTKHIHCYIELNQKIQLCDQIFDVCGIKCEFEIARGSLRKNLFYVAQHDINPMRSGLNDKTFFDKLHYKEQTLNMIDRYGVLGAVKRNIIDMSQIYHANAYKQLQNENLLLRNRFLELPSQIYMHLPNITLQLDMSWDQKKRNYYIYSKKSNYGKTTFLSQLEQQFPCAVYQEDLKYQENFQADSKIILIDEYQYIDAAKLYLMCDGQYYYPQKYKAAVKLQNPIIIIASDKEPSYFYTLDTKANFGKFNSRFFTINLEQFDVSYEQAVIEKSADCVINVQQFINTQEESQNYDEMNQSESDDNERQFNDMLRQEEFEFDSSQYSMEQEKEQ